MVEKAEVAVCRILCLHQNKPMATAPTGSQGHNNGNTGKIDDPKSQRAVNALLRARIQVSVEPKGVVQRAQPGFVCLHQHNNGQAHQDESAGARWRVKCSANDVQLLAAAGGGRRGRLCCVKRQHVYLAAMRWNEIRDNQALGPSAARLHVSCIIPISVAAREQCAGDWNREKKTATTKRAIVCAGPVSRCARWC